MKVRTVTTITERSVSPAGIKKALRYLEERISSESREVRLELESKRNPGTYWNGHAFRAKVTIVRNID